MTRRRWLVLVGIGGLLSACTAATPTTPTPTATQAVQNAAATAPVRSAGGATYTPGPPLNPRVRVKAVDGGIVANIPFYAGVDRGYFAAEGIDVDLAPLQDVAASAQAIATNNVQFYIAVPDPVIFNALNRGVDIRILVSSTTNKPTDRPAAFMVRSELVDNGTVKTSADLRGRRVAIANPSSQFYIERALAKGGLTINDVSSVTMSGGLPDILAALRSGNIDAGWLVEPLITNAERQGFAKALYGTGELYPGAVGTALIMSPSFERDNPEAALRFLIAYLRGQRDYYHALNAKDTDPGPVIESLTAHTQVKDPNLYQVMGLPSLDPNGSVDPTSWDPFQDYYVARGILERKVDLSKYLDQPLVNQALDKLGRL
jgi:NitT/TauT family transport system substrate-binding protein